MVLLLLLSEEKAGMRSGLKRGPCNKPHPGPLLKKEREQNPPALLRIFSINLPDPTVSQRFAVLQSVQVHK
jgi:hypothetical protein